MTNRTYQPARAGAAACLLLFAMLGSHAANAAYPNCVATNGAVNAKVFLLRGTQRVERFVIGRVDVNTAYGQSYRRGGGLVARGLLRNSPGWRYNYQTCEFSISASSLNAPDATYDLYWRASRNSPFRVGARVVALRGFEFFRGVLR